MPTGYTAPIKDGISFEEYVLGCARAFGATITMRDDPHDKPIPEKFEPSDYHLKAKEKAENALIKIDSTSIEEVEEMANAEWLHKEEIRLLRLNDIRDLRSKYEAMLAQARAWKPPTADHEELKKFMVKQIEQSIDHDCNEKYYLEQTKEETASDWLSRKKQELCHDIDYHTEEYRKEIERTDARNEWIKKLRESLVRQPAT